MSDDFKQFEYVGWQDAVDQYEASFTRLTEQVFPSIFEAVGLKEGTRLLDVACGPGHLSFKAYARGAKVVGIDFSEKMIAKAVSLYPSINFRKGDAENLTELSEASFDAVAISFGILHFGQPQKAIQEAHRLLVPGGRVAFTVWDKPEASKGFSIVLKAIENHGDSRVALPKGPPFFHYSNPEECISLLTQSGFSAEIQRLDLMWYFDSPEELFDAFYYGTARTGGLLKRQTVEQLSKIKEAVSLAARAYLNNGIVRIPMPALLAWGVKR